MKRHILIFCFILTTLNNIVAQDYATLYIVKDKKSSFIETTHSHNININNIDVSELLPGSYLKVLVPQGKVIIKDSYRRDIYTHDTNMSSQTGTQTAAKQALAKAKNPYQHNMTTATTHVDMNMSMSSRYVGTKDEIATLLIQAKAGEEYYVHLNITVLDVKLQLVEKPKKLQKLIAVKDNSVCMAAYNLAELQTGTLAESKPATIIPVAQEDAKISIVDKNIPISKTINDKTFAVIIANENYQEVAKVPFAIHDGEIFAKYCKNTLGIPSDNIHLVTDATYNNLRRQLDWVLNVIQAYGDEAGILFYYAGHGIPDEGGKSAYLLPVDGYGNDINSGYGLEELYTKLGQSKAKRVTIFLDACFSGAKREGDMLVAARGVAREVKRPSPYGNKMVVFSAAQGSETAYPEKEEGHGMFTYFLLKKLQESSGNVTYGELGDYIVQSVSQRSIVVNGKSQTPDVTPSPALGESWKQWKLK